MVKFVGNIGGNIPWFGYMFWYFIFWYIIKGFMLGCPVGGTWLEGVGSEGVGEAISMVLISCRES